MAASRESSPENDLKPQADRPAEEALTEESLLSSSSTIWAVFEGADEDERNILAVQTPAKHPARTTGSILAENILAENILPLDLRAKAGVGCGF